MLEDNENTAPPIAPAHTPGPWDVNDSPKTNRTEVFAGDLLIADAVSPHLELDESRANAAFIVRACNSHYELVSALNDLLKSAEAIQFLMEKIEDPHEVNERTTIARCPSCNSEWSSREVHAMLRNLSGNCMCGNWSFDMHAAIDKATQQ